MTISGLSLLLYFFTFFILYKWYQIAQSIANKLHQTKAHIEMQQHTPRFLNYDNSTYKILEFVGNKAKERIRG